MTIEDTEQIDIIGVSPSNTEVILTIADHLDWSDEYDHLLKLQAKINTYMAFVESGEILESYPQSVGKKPVIEVVFKNEPSTTANEFLKRAAPTVRSIGAELRMRTR